MDAHANVLRGASAAKLLHQAAQNIEAARLLLESGHDPVPPEVSEALATAARLEALLPGLIAPSGGASEGHWLLAAAPMTSPQWAPPHEMIDQVNERFGLTGVACARVLLYLAAHTDRLVPVKELATAIGLRARSTGVIKVYVCRLRKAFVEHGFSAAAFETGSGGYAYRGALHPSLTDMLTATSEAAAVPL